jgi:NAD(P)-dependent dehydrogenase (short-subunit alcohol dehydrogenase family)
VKNNDTMQGESVLVTGGGSGLGRGIAERLLSLGARVHICGRRAAVLESTAAEMTEKGGDVVTHVVDIRDATAVDAMFNDIWSHGPLTGLVNNAAANFISPTERLSPRGFDAIANTVFHGTFYVTHAAGKRWIADGKSGAVVSIVNTGVVNGAPFTVPAVMSKAAICAMTKSLAIEWGRHGIRLNAVGPGLIPTPGAQARLMPGDSIAEQVRRNPMQRLGTIDELQSLVAFLLARECGWLTGQVIMLDGAHHLANGNLFSPLLELSDAQWDDITARIRATDAKEKAQHGAASSEGAGKR